MFTYFAIVNGQQKNIQTLISPPGRESEKNKVLPFIPGLICMEFLGWAPLPNRYREHKTKKSPCIKISYTSWRFSEVQLGAIQWLVHNNCS